MRRRIGFCLLVCAWMCPLMLRAQAETTTSITGIVTDSSGAAVSAATLTVQNQQTGATREAGGEHSFPPLLPGVYAITVSHPGKAVVIYGLQC